MADLGLWTGLNQAVQNTTAMGMQLFQMRQQREHQQRLEADSAARLKMAQDQSLIQNASATIDLDKKRKDVEFMRSGWEPSIDPAIKALPESDQKSFLEMIDQMKVPKTQEGRIQAANILVSNQTLYKQYTTSLFQKKLDDYFAVETEYNAALEKGDPQKIEALKSKYEAAAQTVHKARGDIDKGIKTVAMNETWNKLPDEIKNIPILKTAYQIGVRTGDTAQFDRAMLELTKETAAASVREATQRGIDIRHKETIEAGKQRTAETIAAANARAAAANATRVAVAGTTKESPSTDRLLGKEKADVEAKILTGGDEPEKAAYASRYNELSDKDEYIYKPGAKGTLWNDAGTWVKQPKSGATAGGADKETGLRQDLMKNGYTKEAADAYIKKAKAAGKL